MLIRWGEKALIVSDLALLLVIFRVPGATKHGSERVNGVVVTSAVFFVSVEATVQLGKSSCYTQYPLHPPAPIPHPTSTPYFLLFVCCFGLRHLFVCLFGLSHQLSEVKFFPLNLKQGFRTPQSQSENIFIYHHLTVALSL